jgi:hypothetical protein
VGASAAAGASAIRGGDAAQGADLELVRGDAEHDIEARRELAESRTESASERPPHVVEETTAVAFADQNGARLRSGT